MVEAELRRVLVRAGRELYRQGMMAGAAGNLSARLDDERLLITPTGVAKGRLRPLDMIVIDFDGNVLVGEGRPSSETPLHLAIYRRFPGVRAVVHAHPLRATALAVTHRPIPPGLHPEALFALGGIAAVPYPAGGASVADAAAVALDDADAALLLNHGAVTIGKSVQAAQGKMETLEGLAALAIEAHLLGGAVPLPQADVERLRSLWRQRRW